MSDYSGLPLSEEQRDYAMSVSTCLSETFAIARHDVRLVLVETPDVRVVAIDGSPNGQHAGVYDSIVERRRHDEHFFTIEIDGAHIDVFPASDKAAYRAMIADARTRGIPLPDSLELSQQNDELWTATMLMGEALTSEGLVEIASVSGGTVNTVGFRTDRGGRSIRVRPAVVVAQVDASA